VNQDKASAAGGLSRRANVVSGAGRSIGAGELFEMGLINDTDRPAVELAPGLLRRPPRNMLRAGERAADLRGRPF
jgi:hypothetical protein